MEPDLRSKHQHRYFLFVHHEPQSRRCRVSSSHISSEPLVCNVSSDLIFQLATSSCDIEQFIHPANIGTFFKCTKKKRKKMQSTSPLPSFLFLLPSSFNHQTSDISPQPYSQTTKSRGRLIFLASPRGPSI